MDSPATPQALSTGTSTALPPPSTSSQTANLLVLTYTVEVTDDSATGNDTNTNTVTITIGGTNDQPTISADTASIAETDARLTDTGTLNIGDLDTSDEVSAQVIDLQIDASAIANGNEIDPADLEAMFSIDPLAPATVIDGLAGNTTGTLDWHFDSAATTFDFLADGESPRPHLHRSSHR